MAFGGFESRHRRCTNPDDAARGAAGRGCSESEADANSTSNDKPAVACCDRQVAAVYSSIDSWGGLPQHWAVGPNAVRYRRFLVGRTCVRKINSVQSALRHEGYVITKAIKSFQT